MENIRKEVTDSIRFASWITKQDFDVAHNPLPRIKETESELSMPYHVPNAATRSKFAPITLHPTK